MSNDVDFDPPPFRYWRDGAGRIVVTGEVDMASAVALRPVLLASSDPIDLDLTGVTFMDSAGVRVLMMAREVRRVHVAAASTTVWRVLDLLGLRDLLSG